MADAVTTQVIADGDKIAVVKITNLSDGSGESAVAKIDVSALNSSSNGDDCTRVTINQIWYDIAGMRISLDWNASTNVVCLALGGAPSLGTQTGYMDFRSFGGITNNAGSGINGDLLLTTSGHTNLDHYTILLELSKSY